MGATSHRTTSSGFGLTHVRGKSSALGTGRLNRALRVVALGLIAWLLIAITACGGKENRPAVGVNEAQSAAQQARRNATQGPVSGHVIAAVDARSLGPFWARREATDGARGLIAWVTNAEGSGRRILVVPVGPTGNPRGGETVVAHVSVDTQMLVVQPSGGSDPGFLIAWTSLTERGQSLWTMAVGDDGAARTKPLELTRTNEHLAWIDLVPTPHGALALWAEEPRSGGANLVTASLDSSGKLRGVPTRIARNVLGWHAFELPDGVGVSTVDASEPTAPSETRNASGSVRAGVLTFHRLDGDGHPKAPPITITPRAVVSGDVDVTRSGERIVFAWTDRTGSEPVVSIAASTDTGIVEPPRKLIEARGGASLLGLSGGPAGLGVLFEAPIRRKNEPRRVHLARVSPSLTLTRRPLSLDVLGRGRPELIATASGFSVLATTANCDEGSADCPNAGAVATLYRADADLEVIQREPMTFVSDPAALGWNLRCDHETCFALALSSNEPSSLPRVRIATLRPRASVPRKPPPPIEQPIDGPHLVDVTALVSGESFLDLATARVGETTLLASLSVKASDPMRRQASGDDARATTASLAVRTVDEHGVASSPNILTTRALHAGGVALAPAEKPEDGAAVAWVAREDGDPQVHIARIDRRGRRTNHVQLTTAKGDASFVTLTWVGNGWVVAWVDGRDGNGEVYATKVALDLNRTAREERITKAPGDASDLVALARGDAVWLAWADPRESPNDGLADVYLTSISTRDAKPVLEERRILSSAAHSRSPRLAMGPYGLFLAWIEEAPLGAQTPTASGYGAFLARLDENGTSLEPPSRLPLAGEGAASAIALTAIPALRAVVARGTPEFISLDAVDLSAPIPRTNALLALDGPPSLDVAMVLARDALYFNDEGTDPADRRVRRAHIAWSRDIPPPR
jgi:hypothetical protein